MNQSPIKVIEHIPGAFENYLEEFPTDINWQEHNIKVYGQEHPLPRLTAWYGPKDYTYSGIQNPAQDIPPSLKPLFNNLKYYNGVNSVLCNLYRDGSDSVNWHSDDESIFDPNSPIISISFGAVRRFAWRNKETGKGTHVDLHHGDMVIMHPGMQETHEHCIRKTTKKVGPRINLTFRKLA